MAAVFEIQSRWFLHPLQHSLARVLQGASSSLIRNPSGTPTKKVAPAMEDGSGCQRESGVEELSPGWTRG
ncbi:MAG: hypothetical protein KDC10_15580, partial [Calditrichaeota bacterium]|nr:hypothetical protein [Calditrichota bacterium]